MQRVNLGKPYEEFIQKLVEAGYYASASEVLRDALRLKMEQSEKWQKTRLLQLVQEGIDDAFAGRVLPFNEDLINKALETAKQNATNSIPLPDHIKP
ncbi:MAG TPA: type II toxin-antitoxin system ParD family antitoxin [Saprospiraceae bacterium]|nr:type II toxin-antitoxin system ParD family antitoxin [Saprospiraceae bacterium]